MEVTVFREMCFFERFKFEFIRFWMVVIILLDTFAVGQKSQCELVAAKAALENQNTVVNTTAKNLIGTWLSEGCEIRPGPEFLLRSYTFKADGSYRLIQHRYWDDSCSNPKFTVTSNGMIRLKRDSLLNPGGASGYVRTINIKVIPQDARAAEELETLVASECPEQTWKSWRRHEEHLVFESSDHQHNNPHYNSSGYPQIYSVNHQNAINTQRSLPLRSGHVACMGSLKWAFNELKLIKIQLRPDFDQHFGTAETRRTARYELLLGDVHSRREQREHYVPTSFEVPLLKKVKEDEAVKINGKNYVIKNSCNICLSLYASDKSPPHLLEKPHLPPYIWGEWTSLRCEIRPMGLYLTRKFSFYSEHSEWIGEHKFYQDPFCSTPKFVVTAAGHFTFTSASSVLGGTTNIDFKIERASLTLFNKMMAHEMRLFNSCGSQYWQAGVPQELSSTNGCLQLGIVIPSMQYDIVKIEMNYEGSCLLYLGQPDTDNIARSGGDRPTSFQVPLMKCGEVEKYSQSLRDILNDDEYFHSTSPRNYINYYLLVFLIISKTFLYISDRNYID